MLNSDMLISEEREAEYQWKDKSNSVPSPPGIPGISHSKQAMRHGIMMVRSTTITKGMLQSKVDL